MLDAAILVVFPFCMLHALFSDMLSMTISNRVSFLLVAAFAFIAPLAGMEWQAIGVHFAIATATLTVSFCLFAVGAMGGGDAKLIAATALWMGFGTSLAEYVLFTGVIGGVLTLGVMMYRNSALAVFTGRNVFLRNFADGHRGIPYGVALGAAGLIAYSGSPLMQMAMARMAGG